MSGEQHGDHKQETEDQMRAAEALIESLEEEVESLRRDLEQASAALKSAQEDAAHDREALQESEKARAEAERKAQEALNTVDEQRIRGSEEELEAAKDYVAEYAQRQDEAHDRLLTEIESTLPTEDREALAEAHRKIQLAAEESYEQRISVLERSYEDALERLREAEQEPEKRSAADIEALHQQHEQEKRELERTLTGQFEERLQEALRSAAEAHERELQALKQSFADREQELQTEQRQLLERQRSDFVARLEEMEANAREADERHQAKLREVKARAENREQELRKTHSARLASANAEAERRIETLRRQREADNAALRAHHAQDLDQLRAQYEERMREAAERGRLELWSAEEKLEGLKLQRTSEAAAYISRLEQLESERLSQGTSSEDPAATTPASSGDGDASTEEMVPQETFLKLQERVRELEESLSISERARGALVRELERSRRDEDESQATPAPAAEIDAGHSTPERESPEHETQEQETEIYEAVEHEPTEHETLEREIPESVTPGQDKPGRHIPEREERELEPEERYIAGSRDGHAQDHESARDDETYQGEAREESQQEPAKEREAETHSRPSDPETELRKGLSAFNESEHARHVASISKSLGQPDVHIGLDEETGNPVFTFSWEDLAWRRYAAEASEGSREGRVYLLEIGENLEQVEALEQPEPNARIDSQGRVIPGVQAH